MPLPPIVRVIEALLLTVLPEGGQRAARRNAWLSTGRARSASRRTDVVPRRTARG